MPMNTSPYANVRRRACVCVHSTSWHAVTMHASTACPQHTRTYVWRLVQQVEHSCQVPFTPCVALQSDFTFPRLHCGLWQQYGAAGGASECCQSLRTSRAQQVG